MKEILGRLSKKNFALFVCAVFMFAMIYSRFALSVSMIALLLLALFDFDEKKAIPFKINPLLKSNFKNFLKAKPFAIICIIFFIVFCWFISLN